MTANGTEISDGESLSGSQVLRVYGSNLTPPYFSLWFNGVEYTPLDYGDGYVEYVLQDNGTYEIRNEHDVVMEFGISNVVIPEGLPAYMSMRQNNANNTDYINSLSRVDKCFNYPFLLNDSYPIYQLQIGRADNPFVPTVIDDFTGHNCSVTRSSASTDDRTLIRATILERSIPAYIEYKGFIVAVFNYTTTPQP